ncbi:MAG: sulfatase-like hydrolase/transferase [Anaerolineae bacterium]|nr:sulfatase-like hydrolase/transferase [Anaerolineae bacterium]
MPDLPNILWLMTDEQRLDSLSFTGSRWAHTPNLDRIANAGTRFSHAYTPSPVCVSARASMLTGLAASSTGVLSNHHALSFESPPYLPQFFTNNGYQVASFGKHHYNSPNRAFETEVDHVLGDRVHYFEYKVPVDQQAAGIVRYDGGNSPWLFAGRFPGTVDDTPEMHNVQQALNWIKHRDPSRPYFLRLSFNAPHTPVVTPAPFDTLIDPDKIDLPIDWSQDMDFVSTTHQAYLCDYAGTHRLNEAQIRRARQCYYGYVACVDFIFGSLMQLLSDMGEMENTVVVFVSDHGTHLGDHGFFQKQSYWDASCRVPFFMTGPGIKSQIIDTPVSCGSLLPTVLGCVGLIIPEYVQYPSLSATLRQGVLPAEAPVFSEIDYGIWNYRLGERYVMVRDGRYKLTLYRDPQNHTLYEGRDDRVLFDLELDPLEVHNLAGDPAYTQVVDDLISAIDRWDDGRIIVEPVLVKDL